MQIFVLLSLNVVNCYFCGNIQSNFEMIILGTWNLNCAISTQSLFNRCRNSDFNPKTLDTCRLTKNFECHEFWHKQYSSLPSVGMILKKTLHSSFFRSFLVFTCSLQFYLSFSLTFISCLYLWCPPLTFPVYFGLFFLSPCVSDAKGLLGT